MTNIILIARDRPRLTEQTLRTLYMNTDPTAFNLCVVNDGSQIETTRIIEQYQKKDNCTAVHIVKPVGIVGFLKNLGAWVAERYFGRGKFLYFSDNDVAFEREWLMRMTDRLEFGETQGILLLGGYRHPFHGSPAGAWATAMAEDEGILITDAVAGYSHLMRWSTWDAHGPYDQHAVGVCQSEDFALCQKVIARGGAVGYIHPPVIHNCGITNSEGKPAIGAEHFPRVKGLIYE